MLKYRLIEILKNKYMYVAILLTSLIMLIGVGGEGIGNMRQCDLLYFFEISVAVGYVMLTIPILTAIPYVCAHFESNSGNFLNCSLVRSGRKKHYLINVLVAYTTGFMVVLLASGIYLIMIKMIMWGKASVYTELFSDFSFWEKMVINGHGKWNLYIRVILLSCYGGIWSLMAYVLSLFVKNKYVIVATPAIIQMLLSYITMLPIWAEKLWILDPGQLGFTGNIQMMVGGGIPYAVIYEGVVVCVLTFLGYYGIRRRYING